MDEWRGFSYRQETHRQLAFTSARVVNKTPVQTNSSPSSGAEEATRLASLMQVIAAGDQQALGDLYDITSPRVYGLAVRILGEVAAAEDVVIEVYAQVWSQAGAYDARRGSVLAWLLTRTRSRAIDLLRSRNRATERTAPLEQAGELPAETPDPEETSLAAERRRLIQQALEGLQPEQRQVIELAYFSGLSHTEIAARLDQPLGTVKTRVRTGMLRLRESLDSLGLLTMPTS